MLPDQLAGHALPCSCSSMKRWSKSQSVFSWDGADAGWAGTGEGEGRLGMKHTAGMGEEGQAMDAL